MNRKHTLANAILWAAAIVASAILHAPALLTLGLLPILAATALLMARAGGGATECRT